jgi:hypothetical protein
MTDRKLSILLDVELLPRQAGGEYLDELAHHLAMARHL